jgi:hypothetical protein
MARLGSGEMTVRPEKSTRFPERFPRKRPLFPLRRWQRPRIFFSPYDCCDPGSSPLMKRETWVFVGGLRGCGCVCGLCVSV